MLAYRKLRLREGDNERRRRGTETQRRDETRRDQNPGQIPLEDRDPPLAKGGGDGRRVQEEGWTGRHQ